MSQYNEPQPKRSRFVINLDNPPPSEPPRKFLRDQPPPAARTAPPAQRGGSRSRGRWKKILLGLVLVFLMAVGALGVGGYLYWQNYRQRPAYSLALIVNAAQRSDKAEFDRLVDTDRIVENFVPQIAEQAGAGVGVALTPETVRRQLEKYAPQFLPQIKEQARAQVEAGVKEFGARAEGYPFWLVALGAARLTDTRVSGDTAQVKLNFRNRPLELTMQRTAAGKEWRIVGVKDDALARELAQQILAKLPTLILNEKSRNDKNKPPATGILEDEIRRRLPPAARDNLPATLPLP